MREKGAPALYDEARRGLIVACKHLDSADSTGQSVEAFLSLLSHISRQNADYILFAGAGTTLSVDKKAPLSPHSRYDPKDWLELIEGLFESFFSNRNPKRRQKTLKEWILRADIDHKPTRETKIRVLFERMDRLHVAWLVGQLYVDAGRKRNLAIEALVQPKEQAGSKLLKQLVRMPASVVVTTNYDSVLEKEFVAREIQDPWEFAEDPQEKYKPRVADYLKPHLKNVHQVYNMETLYSSLSTPGLKFIYLHGSVSDKDSKLVFDRFDYAELLAEKDGLLDYVTHLMTGYPAIYVGFGLDDPSFNLIQERIFSTSGQLQPVSYAFVSQALEVERRWWSSTYNLKIIQYGCDHAVLSTLLQTLADVRQFLCWAEPNRPVGVISAEDRTEGYFNSALEAYIAQDFGRAIKEARAALASTLLWPPLHPRSKSPPFEGEKRILRVADIRIRLGLSHYKERYLDSTGQALQRMKINIDAAKKLIDYKPKKKGFRIFGNSVNILDARQEYSRGNYRRAQVKYEDIESNLQRIAKRAFKAAKWSDLSRIDLEALVVYSYAFVQARRLKYQLVDEKPSPDRRATHAADLLKFGESLWRIFEISREANSEADVPDENSEANALEPYYRESFATLASVAFWFSARHQLGGFTDVIPLSNERQNCRYYERINSAIADLKLGDLDSDNHVSSVARDEAAEATQSKVSHRWLALRYRYLARAYCLKWFFHQLSDCGESKAGHPSDLNRALDALGEAMEHATYPGLKREKIVTHIEAARIAILTVYAAVLLKKQSPEQLAFSLALTSAEHHLKIAGELIDSEDIPAARSAGAVERSIDIDFLAGLKLRLEAYFVLVRDYLNGLGPKKFYFQHAANKVKHDAVGRYKKFEDKNEKVLRQRINDFEQGFNNIIKELSGINRSAKSKNSRKKTTKKRRSRVKS